MMNFPSDGNWLEIAGFEGYYISDTGLVYSTKTKKLMKERVNNSGYIVYCLTRKGKHYYRLAHRLVAQAFIPNPNNLPEVNHKDENKKCNGKDNLEWCDRSYNINHGSFIERMKKKQGRPILQYTLDGVLVKKWDSIKEASRNGYDFRHIQACVTGKAKTHKGYVWR